MSPDLAREVTGRELHSFYPRVTAVLVPELLPPPWKKLHYPQHPLAELGAVQESWERTRLPGAHSRRFPSWGVVIHQTHHSGARQPLTHAGSLEEPNQIPLNRFQIPLRLQVRVPAHYRPGPGSHQNEYLPPFLYHHLLPCTPKNTISPSAPCIA